MRRVEGTIQRIRCNSCPAAFPTFVFSGDTDMAIDGLVAVTSIDTGALALGGMTGEEYRADYSGAQRLLAKRVSRELNQCMVAVDVARYEDRRSRPGNGSFQQFRESYEPPEAIYVCPVCGGDARIEEELSHESFMAGGGQLILVDDLTLGTP